MGAMNELIDRAAVDRLVRVLADVAPGVAWTRVAGAGASLDDLSLRERTDHVSRGLLADLAAAGEADYSTAARTFRSALRDAAFTGWTIWPVTESAVTLALGSAGSDDFEDCLLLLAELTPRLTGEFAIRRLLAADLDRALAVVLTWTAHPDEHVRRLASEGTRPYLPWAVRIPGLIQRPEATLPILDALYRDPVDYVRRSVANHLNDLARHSPEAVLATAAAWAAAPDANTSWVLRHGLRTLVKKAHPGALALQGFAPASLAVTPPRLDRDTVTLPADLGFEFEISNTGAGPARLAVDYVVHYMKANGSQSEKVFKLAALTLDPGETRTMTKRHAFRQMTTRVHHPGSHALELQINGVRYAPTEFVVEV
ncbi:DNA alkylation repair protein [Arthrobacter oryzae]|uniref:DNA alkylation repair protein n=1 Tax=Arthrobacter oryzae TaxID=409290 RepID=UPI00273C2770|nr:DNA alkylation repair protein [Arthrobacter oryzae]WLQ07369.1 DNA alkylation repair protein [Arthrobacter oryzae]